VQAPQFFFVTRVTRVTTTTATEAEMRELLARVRAVHRAEERPAILFISEASGALRRLWPIQQSSEQGE
jgi:hypothetical protein